MHSCTWREMSNCTDPPEEITCRNDVVEDVIDYECVKDAPLNVIVVIVVVVAIVIAVVAAVIWLCILPLNAIMVASEAIMATG